MEMAEMLDLEDDITLAALQRTTESGRRWYSDTLDALASLATDCRVLEWGLERRAETGGGDEFMDFLSKYLKIIVLRPSLVLLETTCIPWNLSAVTCKAVHDWSLITVGAAT